MAIGHWKITLHIETPTDPSKILDASLIPIEVPPFKKIFVSESGQVYIQPIGAEPNTRVLVNQIALNSGVEDNVVKDIDGELRPKGGFDRTTFNPDQNARLLCRARKNST